MNALNSDAAAREHADQTALQRYEKPAVIMESGLEVRAGSPLGIPELLDLDAPGQS
jgi:hypothetical protein